ncbi:uncharacterized protein LOC143367955 [Andrena cerasifolii]|uniref:uncharacterized protein LOC143367955 n=1 Tax=Andrena cerasifolii TaxID=2819439 RepID=UPI0040377303
MELLQRRGETKRQMLQRHPFVPKISETAVRNLTKRFGNTCPPRIPREFLEHSEKSGRRTGVDKRDFVEMYLKRIGTRLRNLKNKTKGLGGKGHGKLTAKLIDELTVYYRKAIRNSCNSITQMKRGIWATFYHKISTDNKPQHQNCPAGNGSWCSWQKAKAENKLHEYRHNPALTREVIEAICPIYEELSSDNLLEPCLDGFTQNSNASLNALFWKIAPKTIFSGATIIEIAAIFNDGHKSLLQILDSMNIKIEGRGSSPHYFE